MADSNIIVATFEDESKTYQAFSEIKRAALEGQLKINGLTVMHRNLEGSFVVKDSAIRNYGGSITGGIIGSLIGIMGGPLGVLLGWAGGAFLGGMRDAREIMSDQNLFRMISKDMNIGDTALIGEVESEKSRAIDQIVSRLGGELLRRPTEDVEADIRAMEQAQDSARNEALRVLDSYLHPDDRQPPADTSRDDS
ncbi:MAG: DUF1269 domain-containing protein [Thermomicrobiales bacterium]|nr:DUF1269 domain-containing protein [Thermomicrobiales bacterium]MCO5218267.1 DUF1269 domain-containing protein [Thermomicrobiales bacterium]MCO5224958.1 DUF1269 domain-containing protein [Thermomicrobiales bacterium]MCO5227764.1 DUF1269 domain-containing protein [Thermomicrobiales bacterium]